MIDNTFIALASNILGDTDSGLSGREICEYLAEYAVEYNVVIPYASYSNDALNKKNNNIYTRNLLDDLRFSLEVLVKAILKNSKSLENQKAELGNFLKENGISVEIRNLYTDKILEFYTDYQNHNVKHNENYNEIEVDFIFEQTAVLMRLLIKLDNKKKTT